MCKHKVFLHRKLSLKVEFQRVFAIPENATVILLSKAISRTKQRSCNNRRERKRECREKKL